MTPKLVAGSGDVGSLASDLTTLLMVDVSGSMLRSGKLEAAREAARVYVSQMRSEDQAGLMAFNTEAMVVQPVTSDQDALNIAIDSLEAGRDTAMYDALVKGVQELEGISGRKAIIVLTDGLDNNSVSNIDTVIDAINPSGLTISPIGLGDPQEGLGNAGLDESGLQSLAEKAGGVYGYADSGEVLRALYQQQGRALQSEYIITYLSPTTLRDGINRVLTVSLDGSPSSMVTQYNPGGLLPEVQESSWGLFALMLVGLLVLLAVPSLLKLSVRGFSPSKPGQRIKLEKGPAEKTRPNIRLK